MTAIYTKTTAQALGLAALLAASPAHAQTEKSAKCPQTMQEGQTILLSRQKPFYEARFSLKDGKLTEARKAKELGRLTERAQTYYHPLVPASLSVRGYKLDLEIDEPVSKIADLPKLKKWVSSLTILSAGNIIGEGSQSLMFRGTETIFIGQCSYDTWRIRASMELPSRKPVFFEHFYAPTLGLILKSIRYAKDGQTLPGTIYTKIQAVTD